MRLKVMCEVDDDESFIPFGFANRMVPRLVPYLHSRILIFTWNGLLLSASFTSLPHRILQLSSISQPGVPLDPRQYRLTKP